MPGWQPSEAWTVPSDDGRTYRLSRWEVPDRRAPGWSLGDLSDHGRDSWHGSSHLAVWTPMENVSQILLDVNRGDPRAAEQLLPLVYDELRKLAAHNLAHEAPGQTLQPTALVHEAYLRLVGNPGHEPKEALSWDSRGHFFAAAAEAMRRILVDNARRKQAVKHGGGARRVPLEEFHRVADSAEDMLDLDDALTRFAAEEPHKARLVQLRFFAGLSTAQAAAALDISVATAERWWTFARAWLYSELQGGGKKSPIREGGRPDFTHYRL